MTPIPSMIGLGLGYAIYGVVLWPSIATVVQHREWQLCDNSIQTKSKLLGTAFGFSMSALNTALTIIPFLSAKIRTYCRSFYLVELFYFALGIDNFILGAIGILIGIVLMYIDYKNGQVLQKGIKHDPQGDIENDVINSTITNQPEVQKKPNFDINEDTISNAATFKSLVSLVSGGYEQPVLGTSRYQHNSMSLNFNAFQNDQDSDDDISVE